MYFKKRKNSYILIFCLVLSLAFLLVACNGGNGDVDKTEEPGEATALPTPVATAEPTEAPTPAPSPRPLEEDQKGIPQEESVEIYKDAFEDDEYDPSVMTRGVGLLHVENNQLYLSYDGYEYVDDWDTYTPDEYFVIGETYSQIEYHINFKTQHPGDQWMACHFGLRVEMPEGGGGIPTELDAGVFVAFCEDLATVYPGSAGQWPGGATKITLPERLEDFHTIIIVDTGDAIYYYMVLDSGDRALLLKVDLTQDEILVTDGDGAVLFNKGENLYKDNVSGYFKIFNHMGETVIDSIVIKGYR